MSEPWPAHFQSKCSGQKATAKVMTPLRFRTRSAADAAGGLLTQRPAEFSLPDSSVRRALPRWLGSLAPWCQPAPGRIVQHQEPQPRERLPSSATARATFGGLRSTVRTVQARRDAMKEDGTDGRYRASRSPLAQCCMECFGYGNMSHARQNARISSGRPKEMRMYVSSGGKRRPIRILFLRKCSITSSAG